jgi:hypothetical protein
VPQLRVSNPDVDPFVSAVLKAAAADLEADYGAEVLVNRASDPQTKGALVDAFVTGIASQAVWDVIKLAARRFRNRTDYKAEAVIDFDGRNVTIDELANAGDDPEASG